MSEPRDAVRDDLAEYPLWVLVWFGLDAVLALFPPIYWYMGGAGLWVAGIPASLFYFAGTAVCVSASIMAAYIAELRRGNFDCNATTDEDPAC